MTTKGVNLYLDAKYRGSGAVRGLQRDLAGTKRQMDATAIAGKRFSTALGGSSWRRQVQQAGMQLSDFSVQVAGGQSAMLAFTQNAPQFIQNFGAMGGVIAAAVTILGTMAFMAIKAGESAKEFGDQIEDTTGDLESYFSLLRAGEGVGAEIFKGRERDLKTTSETAKILLQIERSKAYRSVRLLGESLADANTEASIWRKLRLGTDIGVTGDLLEINTLLSGHVGHWKDARAQVEQFIETVRKIHTAGSLDEMYQSALAARDIFRQNVDVAGEMTQAQRQAWEQMNQTIQQLELLGASEVTTGEMRIEQWNRAKRAMHEYWTRAMIASREAMAAQQERMAAAQAEVAGMQQQNQLAEIALKHGKESVQVFREEQKQERAKYEAKLKTLGVTEDMKDALRAAFIEGQRLESLDYGKSQIDSAAKSALVLAGNLANAAVAWVKLHNARVDARAAAREASIGGADRARFETMDKYSLQGMIASGVASVDVLAARKVKAAGGGGGGGGSGVSELEKYMERAKAAYDDTIQLTQGVLGLKDAWEEFSKGLTSTKDLEGFTDRFIEKAREIKQTFELMQEAISSSMMSGFKGLLAGTKSLGEAARDILGSILDRIIDLLMTPVFNSIAGGLTRGILGGLDGMGAKILGPYEGGGDTWSGPRVGGVDGRGGRFALVHSDETITDNRRGGSGNTTVVNMTVNTPDAQSFRNSRRQIERELAIAVQMGQRAV